MGMLIRAEWVLLFVRIIIGICLLYYGAPKIKKLRSNAKDFSRRGFKPGMFWGTLIVFIEFFGGIALLLGAFAEWAAALFGFQMIVGTFWKRKLRKPFTDYSYDLLLIALCLVVMAFGPGIYAIIPGTFFLLRWDVAVIAIFAGLFLAYLPEILGKRYRKWKR